MLTSNRHRGPPSKPQLPIPILETRICGQTHKLKLSKTLVLAIRIRYHPRITIRMTQKRAQGSKHCSRATGPTYFLSAISHQSSMSSRRSCLRKSPPTRSTYISPRDYKRSKESCIMKRVQATCTWTTRITYPSTRIASAINRS